MTKPPRRRIAIDDARWSHTETVHWWSIDVANREVWLVPFDMMGDEDAEPGVEYRMATQFIRNLHILRNDGARGSDSVTIHMHTPGGHWSHGMAIYDAIRAMPYETTIISYTNARSMSSIILQAGTRRYMMPNSYYMIHYGSVDLAGEWSTVHANVKFNERDIDKMLSIYLERAKRSRKWKGATDTAIANEIRDLMAYRGDVFFTPAQAIDWGFADGVVLGFEKSGKLKVTARPDEDPALPKFVEPAV